MECYPQIKIVNGKFFFIPQSGDLHSNYSYSTCNIFNLNSYYEHPKYKV